MVLIKYFKSLLPCVRVVCQDSVEKKNERWVRLSHMQVNPTHIAEGRTFVVSHPSYKQSFFLHAAEKQCARARSERDGKRGRNGERKRDEGVKQVIWMINWRLCEMKWSMWELESLCRPILSRCLSHTHNARLQQVYCKCHISFILFSLKGLDTWIVDVNYNVLLSVMWGNS